MFRLWALFTSAYLRLTAMEFTVIPYAVRERARARIRWSHASHSFIHIFQGRCTSMAFLFAIALELVHRRRHFLSSNFIQYLLDMPYLECAALADFKYTQLNLRKILIQNSFFPYLNE